MKYIVVDSELSGTGIRDFYADGYLKPESLNLSAELIKKVSDWLIRYQDEHYSGYKNTSKIDELDKEGKHIALLIKDELQDIKIYYYSDARLTKEEI